MSAAHSGARDFFDSLEENLIALLMGLMTLITFANVIARYVLNTNILWALETTVYLFAWLVLIGMSYGVKKTAHLGVDVLIGAVSKPIRRALAFLAVAACLAFCFLLLKGSWDYWWPLATERAWLETNDVPMPSFLQFLSDWMNEGERYEKMPRWIPYMALPIGMALLTFRFLQAAYRIATGEIDMVIASHEAETEEAMEQLGAHPVDGDETSKPSNNGKGA